MKRSISIRELTVTLARSSKRVMYAWPFNLLWPTPRYGPSRFISLIIIGVTVEPKENEDITCDMFICEASNECDTEVADMIRFPGT